MVAALGDDGSHSSTQAALTKSKYNVILMQQSW